MKRLVARDAALPARPAAHPEHEARMSTTATLNANAPAPAA